MDKIERLDGTKYWIGDNVEYKGSQSHVIGVSWDGDNQKPLYEIEVPAGKGKRISRFYRVVQADEEALLPLAAEG